jgi:hypothetical protein
LELASASISAKRPLHILHFACFAILAQSKGLSKRGSWHVSSYFCAGMVILSHRKLDARLIIALLILLASALLTCAQELTCDVCGLPIHGRVYKVLDRVDGSTKMICETCEKIDARCFICDLPVKEGFQQLPDGRYICARELRTIIASESDAKTICQGVKNDLDRLLSRFLTLPPDREIQLSIVDKYHLQNLFSAPGSDSSCVWVYGATSTHSLPDNKFVHTVDVLSHLQKPRLMAVSAHEYTHTWMNENVSHERRASMDKNTVEAFCELVAFKYMESLHEDREMENIKENHYTVGQILVLLEAEKKYGFNTVMEWMKNGEDNTISMSGLDRIRAMKDHQVLAQVSQTPALVYGSAVLTPVPDTLVLKGISGSGVHRFALINNATFEAMEKGKVRVGQKALSVKCLEIGKDFVTIQIDGSPETKRLALRAAQ